MPPWLLIDDSPEEAKAFASSLSLDGLPIEYCSAHAAAKALGKAELKPDGVLMDVDLSNELGPQQTGPGMSQNIRIAQQRQSIPSFPLVRFSLREKVIENIGRDSSSDDIFDLKIEKDGLSEASVRETARSKLLGVRRIYDALESGDVDLPSLLGVSDEIWLRWGSSVFQSDFEVGDRPYIKANPLVRLMVHPGLLIEEEFVGFRLGVDRTASKGWLDLISSLAAFAYRGVANEYFPRWWSRGLEQWWQEDLGVDLSLAGTDIAQRIDILSKHFNDIVPLSMPKGSMGNRPWRYCLLTKEQRYETIPVDPARGVRLKPRSPMPSWLDPLYASLGAALQNRDDPRLDKEDLKRLQPYARNN